MQSEKKLRDNLDRIINDRSNWENHLINDKKVINEIIEMLKENEINFKE